ncbi:hypothetical protein J2741_002063 [Methanolinea mesophila]|nr:hypothetical protein [Methanolinea mesophila]
MTSPPELRKNVSYESVLTDNFMCIEHINRIIR